jgi:dCTP deaminase
MVMADSSPMCILPDHEIIELLQYGKMKIVDFSDASLTPNGYDLRIAEVSLPETKLTVKEGSATIPPKAMFFVSTVERVELPPDVAAQLWLRTSWMRKGILAGLGKVDAGFKGTLTFMAFNASTSPVEVPIGNRFVQIVFETLHSPASLTYEKRSGNYQGQSGITLTPLNEANIR